MHIDSTLGRVKDRCQPFSQWKGPPGRLRPGGPGRAGSPKAPANDTW